MEKKKLEGVEKRYLVYESEKSLDGKKRRDRKNLHALRGQ